MITGAISSVMNARRLQEHGKLVNMHACMHVGMHGECTHAQLQAN